MTEVIALTLFLFWVGALAVRGMDSMRENFIAEDGGMPDEQGRDAQNSSTPDTNGGTPGSGEQGKIEDLPEWGQRLIRELRSEATDRRKALEKASAEAAQREQARLAEEGKWKELAEARAAELSKLTPYQQRASELEKVIADSNNRRVALIPDGMKSLVPQLPAEQLAAWLDANWGTLTRKPAPEIDAGAGGGSKGIGALSAEELQMAAKLGLTAEQYAKSKATGGSQ